MEKLDLDLVQQIGKVKLYSTQVALNLHGRLLILNVTHNTQAFTFF